MFAGAVIAREYGLPCIVGATHATQIFQMGMWFRFKNIYYDEMIVKLFIAGDIVRLNGSTGVLEKISDKPLVDINED